MKEIVHVLDFELQTTVENALFQISRQHFIKAVSFDSEVRRVLEIYLLD